MTQALDIVIAVVSIAAQLRKRLMCSLQLPIDLVWSWLKLNYEMSECCNVKWVAVR